MIESAKRVAFQGEPGAYANLAAREALPHVQAMPKPTFEDAVEAVRSGETDLCIIPVENSLHGRIADIHHLLPEAGLYIVGEHFLRIHHQLLGVKGAKLDDIRTVISQAPALGQCRKIIRDMKLDRAELARHRRLRPPRRRNERPFARRRRLRARRRNLWPRCPESRRRGRSPQHDALPHHGARARRCAAMMAARWSTTFVFRVRNVPAALYKAMGGFATNGVNMTKLESYQLGGSFNATQFYADIEGHPEDRPVRLALEELQFFTSKLTVLGVYKAHPFRANMP